MAEFWNLEDAVDSAFRNADEGERYIDRLLSCCKDTGTAIRRLLLLLLLSMTAFELLNRAGVDSITIAFVELKDHTIVRTFLPVVVAYLQYQLVGKLLYWRSLERTYAAALKAVEPGVAQNQLGIFVVPGIPLFSTRYPSGARYERIFSLQQRAEGLFAIGISVLLPLFQVYAYFQLYDSARGDVGPTFWVALGMTAIITLAYLATIVILFGNVVHWHYYKYFGTQESPGRVRLFSIGRRIRRQAD